MREECSLVFTGDIGFDKYMDGQWKDPDLIGPSVLAFLHNGDHVVANVEGPLIARDALLQNPILQQGTTGKITEKPGAAQLLHSMDPAAAGVLDRMHADIWNLCNNHIMDAGPAGVAATLAEAAQHHAKTIGAGMNLAEAARPLILPEAGGIGLFSCGYRRGCKPAGEDQAGCLLWNDLEQIQKNIDRIRRQCRWCVLVVHGGEEFTSLPSPYVRDRYRKFLEMGADIIVAHHPHVPMNYEIFRRAAGAPGKASLVGEKPGRGGAEDAATGNEFHYGDKAIFYSLGNFIFDTDYQRAQFNTDRGVLVKLRLTRDQWSFEAMGLQIERGPEHVTEAALPRIFTNVGEEDYELLEPLSAKAFVAATKRQQIYLNPEEYAHADEAKWHENFWNPKRSGRVPGEALDFQVICPIADREKDKAWQKSSLDSVKEYILEQI